MNYDTMRCIAILRCNMRCTIQIMRCFAIHRDTIVIHRDTIAIHRDTLGYIAIQYAMHCDTICDSLRCIAIQYAMHCDTKRCIAIQYAMNCDASWHIRIHRNAICDALRYNNAIHCDVLWYKAMHCDTICDELRCIAIHRDTLGYIAIQYAMHCDTICDSLRCIMQCIAIQSDTSRYIMYTPLAGAIIAATMLRWNFFQGCIHRILNISYINYI